MDNEIREILKKSRTIAVVGCSTNEAKDAHNVPAYLLEKGYRIIPVNPNAEKIFGKKCHKSLSEVREKIDVVNIFRPGDEVLEITKQAVLKKPKAIWTQLGIVNDQAAAYARINGIKFIMNRCIREEHKRLF